MAAESKIDAAESVLHRRSDGELAMLRQEISRLRKENSLLSGRTQVLREGVLLRFREQLLARNWQPRCFDLRISPAEGLTLRCFELRAKRHKDGTHGDLRMSLHLDSKVEVRREAQPGHAKDGEPKHCFQLTFPPKSGHPIKVLRLGVASDEEADEWIQTLEGAIAAEKADEPQPPPAQKEPPTKSLDYPALFPMHKVARQSVLTSEDGHGVPDCNVVGIINLCITVMVVVHIRLIVESFRSLGFLPDTLRILFDTTTDLGHIRCVTVFCVGLPVFAAVALAIERMACSRQVSELAARMAHGFNCVLCLAVPIAVIRDTKATPTVGIFVLVFSCTLFLKLVSYAHVNFALRAEWRAKQNSEDAKQTPEGFSGEEVAYPENLNVGNMARFIAFPTLVYQASYPRTQRIRRRWLAKRVGELIVCLVLMSIIAEQFVLPTLMNFALPVLSWNVGEMVLALLRIALPNVYLWLFMFYSLFHLWLNILAELTYFGDRLFYKEWWNATNLEDYWRLWNLPVHNWLVKHVFLPLRNAGLSKSAAVFGTFFVSAVFHELLVSVPCHTFRLYAFLGMMAQMPLCKITSSLDKRLKGSQIGNLIFWVTFCIIGQPLCVLLYFAEAQVGGGVQP